MLLEQLVLPHLDKVVPVEFQQALLAYLILLAAAAVRVQLVLVLLVAAVQVLTAVMVYLHIHLGAALLVWVKMLVAHIGLLAVVRAVRQVAKVQ
jgi:hypothetical protein